MAGYVGAGGQWIESPDQPANSLLASLVSGYGNGSSRKTGLIVGTSIAGQSLRAVAAYTSSITATPIKAGQNQIQLVAGGVTALGAAVNDYLAFGLCNQQFWVAKITAIATDLVTIDRRLPRLMRASAGVSKVTAPTLWAAQHRAGLGIFGAVNQMLGGPLDLLPGHGHGGALGSEILAALPALLAYHRPAVVALHLLDNDTVGTTSIQEMRNVIDAAAQMCVSAGAKPVFAAPLPSDSLSAARAAAYDDAVAYTLSVGQRFPTAIGIDPGSLYIDKSNGSFPRRPLAGWTDGVHPNGEKRYQIAAGVLEQCRPAFGTATSLAQLMIGPNVLLSGSGGTANNLVGGSVVPDATTITAQAGVTLATSRESSGALKFDLSIPGASNVSSTQATVVQVYTFPPTWAPDTFVRSVARVRVDQTVNVSMLQLDCALGGGTVSTSFREVNTHDEAAGQGREFFFETPCIPVVDPAATTITATFSMRPDTVGSPSGVVAKFTVLEMGFLLSSQGEMLT